MTVGFGTLVSNRQLTCTYIAVVSINLTTEVELLLNGGGSQLDGNHVTFETEIVHILGFGSVEQFTV